MTEAKLLYKLFESRLVGEHSSQFALSKLDGPFLGERHPDIKVGSQNVYRIKTVPYTNDKPYVTDAATRKESIWYGVPTWGAAGFLPIVAYKPNDIHLALLWRDANAPSWPNHYTLPSGLSHLIDGSPEPLHATALREFREELIFLDRKKTDRGLFEEMEIPFRVCLDGKNRVEVYRNGGLVDVAYPFAIGWGTPTDTVTTTVDLCVMFPYLAIDNAEKNLQVINGEVVDRAAGKVFSRTTALVNFLDIYEGRPVTRIRRFSVNIDEDKVIEECLENRTTEMIYPYYLRLPIEKLQSLTDERLSDLLKV